MVLLATVGAPDPNTGTVAGEVAVNLFRNKVWKSPFSTQPDTLTFNRAKCARRSMQDEQHSQVHGTCSRRQTVTVKNQREGATQWCTMSMAVTKVVGGQTITGACAAMGDWNVSLMC